MKNYKDPIMILRRRATRLIRRRCSGAVIDVR
jgi:hypothetical protein